MVAVGVVVVAEVAVVLDETSVALVAVVVGFVSTVVACVPPVLLVFELLLEAVLPLASDPALAVLPRRELALESALKGGGAAFRALPDLPVLMTVAGLPVVELLGVLAPEAGWERISLDTPLAALRSSRSFFIDDISVLS